MSKDTSKYGRIGAIMVSSRYNPTIKGSFEWTETQGEAFLVAASWG